MPEIRTLESVTTSPVKIASACQCKVTIETPSTITVIEEPDEHGGTIAHINAVDISQDTVTPGALAKGVTAHNRLGQPITGTSEGGGSFPPGGMPGDILTKRTEDHGDCEWVTPASSAEQDNTRPITAAAVYTEIGNINALLATI